MHDDSAPALRWFLVLPAAVAAAFITQIAVTPVAHSAARLVLGSPGAGTEYWIAKVAASLFMGAVFVGAACWMAPSRKRPLAMVSLGAVAVWTTYLAASSVGTLPEFPWPALMGAVGLAGALSATLWLNRGPAAVGR